MTGSIQSSSKRFKKSPKWRANMKRHIFLRAPLPGKSCFATFLAGLPGAGLWMSTSGIAVGDWDHFQLLKSALIEQGGFQPHARMVERLLYPSKPSVVVDLIPFGGIETGERTNCWPPDEDIVMRVTGFGDALESAVLVGLDENLVIPVSLPILLVLKLFARVDRRHEKRGAPDIYTLLRQYGDAGNEDRLYGEEMSLLEAEGYDFELAGARLMIELTRCRTTRESLWVKS